MASTILADNGVISGTAGLKESADSSGVLALQTTTAGGTATTAVTIDTSQNVGIGTSSPTQKLDVNGNIRTAGEVALSGSDFVYSWAGGTTGQRRSGVYMDGTNQVLRFYTAQAEAARIDSSGNLLVGVTSASQNVISKARNSDAGEYILQVTRQQTGTVSLGVIAVSQEAFNAANAAVKVGRDSSTLRSINAGGTVNASGADYAEYMTKAGDFSIAKGDVVGINAEGKLTNVFADAVSFCVKSTDPSYVGGDVWGNEEALGLTRPEDAAPQEEKDAFNAALETARQTVDRIAFAGQVPVNVLGAVGGQFIVPADDNGAIKGLAVSNPTFEQYQQTVGKVIAIEQDGRARIIVKVA